MSQQIRDTFGPAALDAFYAVGDVRSGLPAFAYTDTEFWRLECTRLFSTQWIFAGFAHELSNPGDAVPVSVGGQPLILLCDQNRNIRAFYNACRHRGLKLIEQAGNVGQLLRCPYHRWSYELSGQLRKAPFFGGPDDRSPEGFELTEFGLKPLACNVWHDWVFVNLSPQATAFEEFIAPLQRQLQGLDFARIKPLVTIDFGIVKTNWKFLMENFIEPYHVQFVHSRTTQQPLRDHYTIADHTCLGSAVDINAENPNAAKNGTLAVSSRYLTLFPNFVLGRYFPDQLGVHLNEALDCGHTRQRRVIYSTVETTLTTLQIEELRALWQQVHKEDHAICERLQQGRAASSTHDGGILSPHWESSVRKFQELVLAALE